MTINNRIKVLRKELGMTQKELAEELGVRDAAISKIEIGENGVTKQMVKLIGHRYKVNSYWLETGEGEMFLSPEAELSEMAADIVAGEDNLAKAFLKIIATLPQEERTLLAKVMRSIVEELPL